VRAHTILHNTMNSHSFYNYFLLFYIVVVVVAWFTIQP